MSCCRESTVGRHGQRALGRALRAADQAPCGADSDAGRSQQGWDGGFRNPSRQCRLNRPDQNGDIHRRLVRRGRKLLEALEKAAAHVRAGLRTTGTRVIAGCLVRARCHGGNIGLRRRQHNARRDSDERDGHGEQPKSDAAAMKHRFHANRLPQPPAYDKNRRTRSSDVASDSIIPMIKIRPCFTFM